MKQAVTNVCLALSDDEDYVSFDEDDLNAGIQELYDNDSAEDAASDISNEDYFDANSDEIAAPTGDDLHFAPDRSPPLRFTPPPPPRARDDNDFNKVTDLLMDTETHNRPQNKKSATDDSVPLHYRRYSSPCGGRGGRRAPPSRRSFTSKDDMSVVPPPPAAVISKPKRKAAGTDANDLFESLSAIHQPLLLPSKARPSLNAHQYPIYRSASNHSHHSNRSALRSSPAPSPPSPPQPSNPYLEPILSCAAAPVSALNAGAPPMGLLPLPPVRSSVSRSDLRHKLNAEAPPFAPLASSSFSSAPVSKSDVGHSSKNKKYKLSKRLRKLNMMKERKKRKDRKIIHKQKINTNVISIELGTLKKSAENIATGDPIRCNNKQCGTILSKHDTLEKEHEDMKLDDDDESIWKCRFCQTINVIDIDDEEIPTDETVDYIIEPPDDDSKQNDIVNEEEQKQIIFCIDISGSMCVTTVYDKKINLKGNRLQKENEELSQFIDPMDRNQWMPNQSQNVTYVSRLQSVQAAVDSQMTKLQQENPGTKVGLVTFNNEVTVYGDGMSNHEIIAGDKLNDLNQLKTIGASDACAIQHMIKHSHSDLSDALWKLEEGGQTALGPALSASIAMASHRRGSQVILCTDGLANIGVGAMDGADADHTFYEDLGNWAMEKGVVVSIISITDDGCNLEALGRIAEVTNGNLRRINPLKLTEKFSGILEAEIIATSTTATMFLHPGLQFKDTVSELQNLNPLGNASKKDTDKGVDKEEEPLPTTDKIEKDVTGKVDQMPSSQQDIGNVFADTTIFFEYAVCKEVIKKNKNYKDLKYLPFQVHIVYDKLDGTKMLRVITQQKEVTLNKEKVRENLDYAVLSQYGTRVTTKLCDVGDYEASRAFTNANTRYMHRHARNSQQVRNLAGYVNSNIGLDYQMRQQQGQEIRNYNNNNQYNHAYSPSMNVMNSNWIARGVQISSNSMSMPRNNASAPLRPQRPQSVHFQAATPNQMNAPQQSFRRENRSDKFSSLQYGMKRKF